MELFEQKIQKIDKTESKKPVLAEESKKESKVISTPKPKATPKAKAAPKPKAAAKSKTVKEETAAKVEDVAVTAPEKEDKKAKDWGRASNDPRNKS